ncbi:unnamed protein product [Orchesella dallaii]|uniref:Metalloendopeptidase n=1 Tax=Orchesella dallaii TaxID=48710 RepID=A0ABP1PHD2_9HEXA
MKLPANRSSPIFLLCTLFSPGFGYFLESAEDWHTRGNWYSDRDSSEPESLSVGTFNLWENGQIPYTLDGSLSIRDKEEVKRAFKEYETKTCIRFKPKQTYDFSFVNIKVNNNVCGLSTPCKLGGIQHVQVGGKCRHMNTMVHELGHALCLFHEHERKDRNEYLSFPGYCPMDGMSVIDQNSQPMGLYDYQSIMHYGCGNCEVGFPRFSEVKRCGLDMAIGLSVLDADYLNDMYNCQDCHRHRWRRVDQLTNSDRANLQSFGYQSPSGIPMYPCRTLHRGQVVVGNIKLGSSSKCEVIYSNQIHLIQNNVEVLTIPSFSNSQCTYKLKNRNVASTSESIPASTTLRSAFDRVYIAYGSVASGVNNGQAKYSIGQVSATKTFTNRAQFPNGMRVVESDSYNVLTCSCSGSDLNPAPTTPGVFVDRTIPATYRPPFTPIAPTTTSRPPQTSRPHNNRPNWGLGDWWKVWNLKQNGNSQSASRLEVQEPTEQNFHFAYPHFQHENFGSNDEVQESIDSNHNEWIPRIQEDETSKFNEEEINEHGVFADLAWWEDNSQKVSNENFLDDRTLANLNKEYSAGPSVPLTDLYLNQPNTENEALHAQSNTDGLDIFEQDSMFEENTESLDFNWNDNNNMDDLWLN